MPFIKLNQPKYLKERSMLIADTDPDSTYFEVDEIPGYFTGGKTLLLIGGNKNLLKPQLLPQVLPKQLQMFLECSL